MLPLVIACSCGVDSATYPADGATAVPTNAAIVVVDGREPYALSGPDGAVAFDLARVVDQPTYTVDVLRPLAPLAASTTYDLQTEIATARFSTGAADDLDAPAPPTLGDLSLAHANVVPISSCGDEYFYVDLPLTLGADAIGVEIDVTPGERIAVTSDRLASPHPFMGYSTSCGVRVPLAPGDEVCFDVRALDQAGNVSETVTRCATVTACADIDPAMFDGDLSGCDPPDAGPPDAGSDGGADDDGGCSTTPGPGALAPLLLALYAMRRRPGVS